MTVDEIVKLILAFSVGFSLVVISWQIAMVFGGLAGVIRDFRKAVQNLGTASDMILEDYNAVRKLIYSLKDGLGGISAVFGAINGLSKMMSGRRGNKEEQAEQGGEVSEPQV